jgi:hypothetical protein
MDYLKGFAYWGLLSRLGVYSPLWITDDHDLKIASSFRMLSGITCQCI